MKRFLSLLALAALAVAPSAAQSASTSTSTSAIGVGPHGYDFIIGTWACKNTTPSAVGGPATSTLTGSRAGGGGIMAHITGKDFDATYYLTYSAKTKTWWGPTAFADGSYEIESTKDTGPKATWAGSTYEAATGKATRFRDLYTMTASTYVDVGQSKASGSWKTVYTVNCTKS